MRILWMLALLGGCATTGAPVPPASAPALSDAEAQEARRAAWLRDHRDVHLQLMARAEGLDAAKGELLLTTESWRGGLDVLHQASAACPPLLTEAQTFTEALSARLDAYGGEALPGLTTGWTSLDGVEDQREELARRCAALPELIAAAMGALAVEAEAEAAREDLSQRESTRKAADAVADADRVLRDIVTDAVFVDYLDAIDGWQRAATTALREARKPQIDEARLSDARVEEAAAEQAVGLLNATITLAISGRSDELTTAISAAGEALKGLDTHKQQAVLALFPPEVTPASLVLLQLVGDRL